MFFLVFFFKSKVLYLLSQVKITLNIYSLMFLNDIFVGWNHIYFMCFNTILVTMADPHLKLSTCVSPSIISTKQLFRSNKIALWAF